MLGIPKITDTITGSNPRFPLRVAVIGEEQVGKSALVTKLVSGRFISVYQSEEGHLIHHAIKSDNQNSDIYFDLLDYPYNLLHKSNDSHLLLKEVIEWADAYICENFEIIFPTN